MEGPELLEAEGMATVLFGKTWEDWLPLVDFFLDQCAESKVASRTQVKQYRKGSKPRPKKMKEIIQASALYAWQDLRKEHADSILNRDPLHVLQTWYHLHHGNPDMPI
ncbi:hypothetical protein [Streptomyces sp. cg2]|uniref:hypothetical protein n=1 Tax=Streptomyces sp. cg2 TaxID=3238799 RepID=UPI0034E29AD9